MRHKAYGILTVGKEMMVRVYGATEKNACHDISVKNEDEAQEILRQMQSTYPDAMIGYDAEIEKRYHANPVTFPIRRSPPRRQPAAAPCSRADRSPRRSRRASRCIDFCKM